MGVRVILIFLCIECVGYGAYFILSPDGLVALRRYSETARSLELQQEQERARVYELEQHISDWKRYPACRESYIRQELQYAHEDDSIYWISD